MTAEPQEWEVSQRARAKGLLHLLVDAEIGRIDVVAEMRRAGMAITPSAMSDYLNAKKRWPDDFEQRFRAAVAEKRVGAA